jgi:hypothetical protein
VIHDHCAGEQGLAARDVVPFIPTPGLDLLRAQLSAEMKRPERCPGLQLIRNSVLVGGGGPGVSIGAANHSKKLSMPPVFGKRQLASENLHAAKKTLPTRSLGPFGGRSP